MQKMVAVYWASVLLSSASAVMVTLTSFPNSLMPNEEKLSFPIFRLVNPACKKARISTVHSPLWPWYVAFIPLMPMRTRATVIPTVTMHGLNTMHGLSG